MEYTKFFQKMMRVYIGYAFLVCCTFFHSCASHTIVVNIGSTSRQIPDIHNRKTISSSHPALCYTKAEESFRFGAIYLSDTIVKNNITLNDCIMHANFFLLQAELNEYNWKNNEYASALALRGAWCSLFKVEPIDSGIVSDIASNISSEQNLLAIVDNNLRKILDVKFYSALAERHDQTHEKEWSIRSNRLRLLVKEGFHNLGALQLYIEANIYARILAPQQSSCLYLKKAVQKFSEIRNNYGLWLRREIDISIVDLERKLTDPLCADGDMKRTERY